MFKKIVLIILVLSLFGCTTQIDEEIVEEVTPTPVTVKEINYHLSPDFDEVDDSYFSNTLFVGDSRIFNLHINNHLLESTLLSQLSLQLNKLDVFQFEHDGIKETLYENLEKNSYDKIYINFGLNELGYAYLDIYVDQLLQTIDKIRQYSDADIIVLCIYPVCKDKNDGLDYENNENIAKLNELVIEGLKGHDVYYIDDYSLLVDENNYLKEEYAFDDGVHLNEAGYNEWIKIIKKATIEANNEKDN